MAVQNIWWWFKEPAATEQQVSGSFVASIGLQSAVYAVAAMQRLQYRVFSEVTPANFDSQCYVASYTKNGVSQNAGTPGIFDTDVDSVTFAWSLNPGPGTASTWVTFQIFGFGQE